MCKFKITTFGKTFTLKISTVDTIIKHLKKNHIKPTISYRYVEPRSNSVNDYIEVTFSNVFEFADEFVLKFPVHWHYVTNKPFVQSYTLDTDHVINTLMNI